MSRKLYLIQAERGGPIKVGKAVDPEKRLRELQTGNPHRLVIRAVHDDGDLWESRLHDILHPWRMSGEWFEDVQPVRILLRCFLEKVRPPRRLVGRVPYLYFRWWVLRHEDRQPPRSFNSDYLRAVRKLNQKPEWIDVCWVAAVLPYKSHKSLIRTWRAPKRHPLRPDLVQDGGRFWIHLPSLQEALKDSSFRREYHCPPKQLPYVLQPAA